MPTPFQTRSLLIWAALGPLAACGGAQKTRGESSCEHRSTPAFTRVSLEVARDDFLAMVSRHGGPTLPMPELREWMRPSLISWRAEANAVALSQWKDVSPAVQELFARWFGGEKEAEEAFNWTFRWFLLPHELTHIMQPERTLAANHRESEQLANDLAVAFWKTQTCGPERLQRFQTLVARAVAKTALPAEAAPQEASYFDTHYDELSQSPERYGPFQWRMMDHSLQRTGQLDFKRVLAGVLAGTGGK